MELLEDQIRQLERMADQHGLDVGDEVAVLEAKLDALRQDKYSNLSAVERVQLARHPKRPFTLDYIERAFDDFMELHGDRAFRTTRPSSAAGPAWTAAASCSWATRRAAT
jgi:acetyl-CoA carboxylase carboxyl transferase subunit alpha